MGAAYVHLYAGVAIERIVKRLWTGVKHLSVRDRPQRVDMKRTVLIEFCLAPCCLPLAS